MKPNKQKLNYKDVPVIKGKDAKDYFKVDGGQWGLSEHYTRMDACTHVDCKQCGVEIEKTHSMLCSTCSHKNIRERYEKLPISEWNGKDTLTLFDSDEYFFDVDDIEAYCEDHDIEPANLMLVTCRKTRFNTIDVCDLQQDVVHEDWEPDAELIRLEKVLNDYLQSASTNTWEPDNKRVIVDLPYKESEVSHD